MYGTLKLAVARSSDASNIPYSQRYVILRKFFLLLTLVVNALNSTIRYTIHVLAEMVV